MQIFSSWTDLTVIYQLSSTMISILYYHFGRVPRSCCSYLDILVGANVQRLQTHSAPDARSGCGGIGYCWAVGGMSQDKFILLRHCDTVIALRLMCWGGTNVASHTGSILAAVLLNLQSHLLTFPLFWFWNIHVEVKFHPQQEHFSISHLVYGDIL